MLKVIIIIILGAVELPQTSPNRNSHRGSPIAMDENKSRTSPGLTEQSGSSRALYSIQEQEEVCFIILILIPSFN